MGLERRLPPSWVGYGWVGGGQLSAYVVATEWVRLGTAGGERTPINFKRIHHLV